MVLGIENKSENWKTARCLAPLFGDRAIRLARRLGEPDSTASEDVRLELFWKGVRDYRTDDGRKCGENSLVRSYGSQFDTLRKSVKEFGQFQPLRPDNYKADSEEREKKLTENLFNTEIDIVLESPTRLYVGEAKYTGKLHANAGYVLVHQLIRQYVMARIVVDISGCDKTVIPFVVGANRKRRQIEFMIGAKLMLKSHVLNWEDVEGLNR